MSPLSLSSSYFTLKGFYFFICILLLQLFILRAEAELQATSRDSRGQNLQLIDNLRDKIVQLFGGDFLESVNLGPKVEGPHHSQEDIFRPRRIGKQALADIRHQGDWMTCPVSNDEIAWLAKLLMQLSDWLNEAIGLDQAKTDEDSSKPSYVKVRDAVSAPSGPAGTVKLVLWAVGSWLLVVGGALVRLMRKHGVRVNLRIFASKKVIVVAVLVSALFVALRRAVGVFLGV